MGRRRGTFSLTGPGRHSPKVPRASGAVGKKKQKKKTHLLQRDGVDVARDHPAEGAAQVVDDAAVGLLGQQFGEDGEHHGIVPAHRPLRKTPA